MSNSHNVLSAAVVRSQTVPFSGRVVNANKTGIKINDVWYDYGTTFKGERRDKEALVGMLAQLTLVESKKEGKWFIRSVDSIENPAPQAPESQASMASLPIELPVETSAPPAAEAQAAPPPSGEAPQEDRATEKQVEYAQGLAEKLNLSKEEVNALSAIRFKKPTPSTLTREEIGKYLIPFLAGYVKTQRSGR